MYISKPDKPLVIMYHGNAGSACDRAGYRQFIENANHGFIFVEYTGFGLNQPRPTHRRVKQDIRNVIAYLDRIGAKDITLMGESLGAAVASLHASQMRPKNLILISPFSTLADAAQAMFPRLPVKPFLFGRYDNLKALEGFEGNSMIIHGDADKLVPYRLGQKLAKSLPVSNQFVTVKGAGHNDLMAQPEAGQAITDFLKQN